MSSSVDSPLPRPASLPLHNAAAVFLVHFHVRRGNELLWQKGNADLAGVEWKVLPSGSHAVERDIIYFETPNGHNGSPRIGLAAFRNTRLAQGVRSGAAEEEADDDQRGARMLAVGAILGKDICMHTRGPKTAADALSLLFAECSQPSTPRSLLTATLPHISRLEGLVDALSGDPGCRDLLEEWLEEHKISTDVRTAANEAISDHDSLLYAHDPLFQLPAITNALGPLLPSLLKRLILPRFRLLLYVPGGFPTCQAAGIAFALGELAYAACQANVPFNQECPVGGSPMKQHGLQMMGLIGLHDIARLQDEAKRIDVASTTSWIAWTTDKILLEKCDMYDAVLDLSPMTSTNDNPSDDLLAMPTALPRLMSTHWAASNSGKKTATLKRQNWTAREFAVFRGIDEQASYHAASRRRKRRSVTQASQSSMSGSEVTAPRSPYLSPSSHLSRQGGATTFLAFLRFWLANLWILPYHWRFHLRESYGYVPLNIRSDGGVQASIMLLPGDDSDGEDSEVEEGEVAPASSPHLSLPSTNSPLRRRHYSGGEETALSDEEDDPILAACGATQASSRQRKSRSHSSLSRSAIQSVADVVTRQLNSVETASNDLMADGDDEEDPILQEAREGMKLSLCISEFWSLWIRELVQCGQDLVRIKLEEERGEQGQDNDETSHSQGHEGPIQITASDMRNLQLSASNSVDVDLIQHLASTISSRPVQIQRSWWLAAACLWS